MTRVLALLIGIFCLAGCSSAPVQEMSDARQAIAAAQVAGAAERAPTDFAAAQAAIARAEEHLQAQQYASAKYAALEAKRRASAALATAERGAESDAPPPH
jgi:PBP1b-binding outer membrane lipoprotein LpoB